MPHIDAAMEPPAYPKSTDQIIRLLKKALERAEGPPGYELSQKNFARLIGAPKSTIHDWYHGATAAPIIHFLCAMERLSETQRAELLRQLCRDFPRLQHPRLAHDQPAVNSLRGLLAQPAGLTFVAGPSDELRTFVFTALGNSAAHLVSAKSIGGLDLHNPELLVPVPGVLYFRPQADSARLKERIHEHWREIQKSPAGLVFLNGVWGVLPEIRTSIIDLAKKRNVFVADEFVSHQPGSRDSFGPRVSNVTAVGGQGGKIRVKVEIPV